MTDLDELKTLWEQHDRALQSLVAINHRLLDSSVLTRARSAMQRLVAFLAIEAIVLGAVILALGTFVAAHVDAPRLAVSGAITGVYSIAAFAALIAQLVLIRRIDYSGPVTAIQVELERVRVLRSRSIQALVVAGTVIWLPITIVLLLALGIDASSVLEPAFVAANVAFGVAVLGLVLWLSRRFADSRQAAPALRRLMRELAGYNLSAASGALRSIAEFRGDDSGY